MRMSPLRASPSLSTANSSSLTHSKSSAVDARPHQLVAGFPLRDASGCTFSKLPTCRVHFSDRAVLSWPQQRELASSSTSQNRPMSLGTSNQHDWQSAVYNPAIGSSRVGAAADTCLTSSVLRNSRSAPRGALTAALALSIQPKRHGTALGAPSGSDLLAVDPRAVPSHGVADRGSPDLATTGIIRDPS